MEKSLDCLPINFATILDNNHGEKNLPKLCSNLEKEKEKQLIGYFYGLAKDGCLQKCETMNYHDGHIEVGNKDLDIENRTFAIWYWMPLNEIQVQKEYLIHDLNGLVGYVGGTLGMFIGVSVFEIFNRIVNALADICGVPDD